MSVSNEIEDTYKTVINTVINILREFTTALEGQYTLLNSEDIKKLKKSDILRSTFQNVESMPQLEIEGTTKKGIVTTLKHENPLKENLTVQTNEYHSKGHVQHVLENGTTLSNITNLVEIEPVATNVQIKRERLTNLLCNAVEEVQVKQEIHIPLRKAAKNQRINKNRPGEINLDALDHSIIDVPRSPLDVVVLEDSFRVTRARARQKVESVAQKGNVTAIKKEKGINIGNPEQSQKDGADGNIITKTLSSSSPKQHVRCDNNSGINEKTQCFTAENKEQQMREPERQEIVAQVTEMNFVTGNTAFSPTQNKCICAIKPTRKNKPVVPVDNTVIIDLSVTVSGVIRDDDRDEVTGSPLRTKRKITQFFTPYENSTVQKYVQAYEKLGAGTATLSKAKLMASKLKCSQTSSTTKALSVTRELSSTCLKGGRTGSALKASQTEFYERQLRRKQKEEEALRKKEALIRAQTEERRRKREEREMKVQQLKMIKEKEKMQQLMSAEKAKEKRFQQILAEKEAKFFKQKEEAAQKSKKDAKRNQQENKKAIVPLLPTLDCYDSDDNTSGPTIHIPAFQGEENLQKTVYQIT